jgi:DNA-binding MarR family transcriptional regulator
MLQWDRSRLSHHLKRMERSELVTRELCLEDGRGSYVVVTDAGRDAIDRAAPPHVDAVRTLFFDVLTTEEALELGRLGRKVLDRVNAERS